MNIKNNWKILFAILILCTNVFAQKKLVNLKFVGNQQFSEWELLSALNIKKPKWYHSIFGNYPVVNKRRLETNLKIIESMYKDKGFLDVKTNYRLNPLATDTNKVVANILIEQGTQYRIDYIGIDITPDMDTGELYRSLKINQGEIFSPYKAEQAKNNLANYIADMGYPYYSVNMEWAKDTNDFTVDVHFTVECGKLAYFGDIHYKGLRNTKKFLLRRETVINKGDLYSRSAMKKTTEDLYSTGLFRIVSVELIDTLQHPDTVNVLISVVENKRGWYGFSFNLGASKQYDFTTELVGEWGHRNIFGNGQSITFRASAEAELISRWQFLAHGYEFKFTEPWTLGKKLPSILTFYFEPGVKTLQYPYRVQKMGGNLNLIKSIGVFTHSGGITYERADIYGVPEDEADEIKQEQGIVISRGLNYTYQRDTRDDPLMPRAGSLVRFNTDFVGGPLGGDEHYLKIGSTWSRYIRIPFWRDAIFANRLKIAVMGKTKKGTDVSIHNRLVTGGANSVRGFDELSIGPRTQDTLRTMLGGKVLFLFSAEIRYPIIWKLWGHTFIDLGQVWSEWKDVNPNDIRASTGMGLAFITPLGPLRVDYAMVVSKHPYDPEQFSRKWHITFMYPY
ncbi:outer membrane protein assembly factor BamA [bacterium]|nr:MAG: outer membrane protein assembly factor BamA [bacterium]